MTPRTPAKKTKQTTKKTAAKAAKAAAKPAKRAQPKPTMSLAQEAIWSLRGQGWTLAQIAKQIDRSADYVGRIARGLTPGHGVAESLVALAVKGKIKQPPPRRTRSDGKLAKVRGKAGAQSAVPTGPATQEAAKQHAAQLEAKRIRAQEREAKRIRAELRAADRLAAEAAAKAAKGRTPGQPEFVERPIPQGRNLFTHKAETFPENGLEYHRITSPRAPNSWNRWNANETIEQVIRQGAQQGKRMQASVIVERKTGEKMTVQLGSRGGYDCGNVARDFASYQFAFEWVRDQIADRPNYDVALDDPNWEIVGIDIDLW